MSTTTAANWRAQAACATADPDLFFPEPDSPVGRIAEAKQICAACPVRQACLEDALRRGEPDAICGGLTAQERTAARGGEGRRTPGKTSARQIAVQHGAYLLTGLVEWRMSVAQLATELGSTPSSVYSAFRMLVPAAGEQKRPGNAPVIETLLATSKEQLRTLARRGISHSEIGIVLNTPQSFISASLSVLRQREEATLRLSRNGMDGVERCQAEEVRVRQEAGVGLTVDDVVNLSGVTILRMSGEGIPLRHVALKLGLCRETVRRAHQQMTSKTWSVKTLTKTEMEEAA